MTQVLLISTYEQGHQPLGLAAPAAALRARGHTVRCSDLSVETPPPGIFAEAELIALSAPMHTAARLALALARRIRLAAPHAHLTFYGLYASALSAQGREQGLADSVIGGEYLDALVALADTLATGGTVSRVPGLGDTPGFSRTAWPLPERRDLPSLERYAHLELDGELRPAGYVEATHGCAHQCRHCPITPVYAGRLRLMDAPTVLADIDQQVSMGAQHITFGDPDFFNAVPHSLAIVRQMHSRHPALTFDATIKVEHLLEHAHLLPQLPDLGCVFVTSAFESVDDALLARLDKGHTRADMERALALAARTGVTLRPTWLAFTPWTSLEDFQALLHFVRDQNLVSNVPAVQYALRLLLPPGSPLLDDTRALGVLGEFDAERLTYTWTHPDPRMEALHARLADLAADDATANVDASQSFTKIYALASQALGRNDAEPARPHAHRPVPGLTEAWFC